MSDHQRRMWQGMTVALVVALLAFGAYCWAAGVL